jgi:hypothetical protein
VSVAQPSPSKDKGEDTSLWEKVKAMFR